jgi:hypothetical protein
MHADGRGWSVWLGEYLWSQPLGYAMNAFRDDIIQFLKSRVPLDAAELQRAIEVPPSVQLGDYAFPCFPLA